MVEICASDFRTVSMCNQKRTCADKFLAMVTAGELHSVYKGVTWSSFSVIW